MSLPNRTEGQWRVRIRDLDTSNTLFQSENKGAFVRSSKRFYVRFAVEVWDLDDAGHAELVLRHDFDAKDRDVVVQFPLGTLGDTLAWFSYVDRFQRAHGCRMVCSMSGLIIPLLRAAYPNIRLVTREEFVDEKLADTAYATYSLGLFFDDEASIFQPTDFRLVGLHRTAGYILGVDPAEEAPRLALPDETRPIDEPYVVIAVQASTQCKMWNNPHGWREVIAYVKSCGYRVVCIDQKPVSGSGLTHTHLPHGAEDQTGDRPLADRARWLRHADLFIGLSSGLSWLAWAAGTKIVLISGFTHPLNEFETPGRVINWHACNSCWNDVRHRFDHKNFMWCPRHAGTDRQFECTRLITAAHVINKIAALPGLAKPQAPLDTTVQVISLARTPERWSSFEATNRDVVGYERFDAIDGREVDRAEWITERMFTADLAYSDGAVGDALSHVALWRQAADQQRSVTLCEDDAIFCRGFAETAAALAASAPDFDVILWGWNMDAALAAEMPGGVPVVMLFDQNRMRAAIEAVRTTRPRATLYRLQQAMGTIAYTVSPRGARRLLDSCLPLRPLEIELASNRRRLRNIGLDVALSAVYASLQAYVCFPPLVVTQNFRAHSTIQTKQ